MRVPAIAWWPGRIRPAVTSTPVNAMDLLPTILALAGAEAPKERVLDGMDVSRVLFEGAALPERPFFYYRGTELFACRLGNFKAHFRTQAGYGQSRAEAHEPPLLFNVAQDPSERFNIADKHAEVIARIQAAVAEHQAAMVLGKNQIDDGPAAEKSEPAKKTAKEKS